ncbi:hypothetical protein ACS0TY_000695 [Phlomoides rotata]
MTFKYLFCYFRKLERCCHGVEPPSLANFPTTKYRELCLSSKENACQRCTVCLADYHDEDTLSVLPVCGHSFHAICISIWLQQNSTCPVCRISLRDLPERKWMFMQPMFSPSLRSQYRMQSFNAHYCHCMANGNRHLPRSNGNEIVQEGDVVRVGDGDSVSIVHEKIDRKVESASI